MGLILTNGIEMPLIGMGTFPLHGEVMKRAVNAAVNSGYRAFDTAHAYNNENSLGDALKEVFLTTNVERRDLFIISKIGEDLENGIPNCKLFYNLNDKKNIKSIVSNQLNETLNNLCTDYLDLLLIHWPHPDYLVEIWRAMEYEYLNGRVKAIGLSNCCERHINEIIKGGTIIPMVNQVELHPLNTKKKLLDYCQKIGIKVQASSPLLVMNRKLMKATILRILSKKYNKSIPQIILRWHIQQGIVPIPKSQNYIRLQENIDIYDFELLKVEMNEIDNLNEDYKSLIESKYCPGY